MPGECAKHNVAQITFFAVIIITPLLFLNPILDPAFGSITCWDQWQGGPSHIGAMEGEGPTEGALRWSYETGDQVLSSPVFYNGCVLTGSDDGWLYCFDTGTGDVLWKYKTEGEIQSTPLISGGKLYFGSFDGFFRCLEPPGNNYSRPTEVWSYETESQILSSAHLYGDSILFGCNDGYLYRLTMDGDLIWRGEVGGEIWGSPAIDEKGGRAIIGNIQGMVKSFYLKNGTVEWSKAIYEAYSSGLLFQGRYYAPGGEDNTLYCMNPANGSDIWTFDIGHPSYSTPSTDGEMLFFGSFEFAWCLPLADPDGSGEIEGDEVVWKTATHDFQGGSSPLLLDGRVYIGSDDYNLYCIDMVGGEVIWNYTTSGYVYSSPGGCNGSIFFGSSDRSVYCVGERLPGLSVGLDLSSDEILSDESIIINITVVDQDRIPAGNSDLKLTCSTGGFSSSPDDEPRISLVMTTDEGGKATAYYFPMEVSSRSTVNIGVKASKEGIPDGEITTTAVVEPISGGSEERGGVEFDLSGDRGRYFVAFMFIILIDILLLTAVVIMSNLSKKLESGGPEDG